MISKKNFYNLLMIRGKIIKIASIQGENWTEINFVNNYHELVKLALESNIKADIFTFAQKIPNVKPMHNFFFKFDNIAAIPLTTYQNWLNSVSSGMRKDLKRSKKHRIYVKVVE